MLSLTTAWGHGAAAASPPLAVYSLALCSHLSLCPLQPVFNSRNSGKQHFRSQTGGGKDLPVFAI